MSFRLFAKDSKDAQNDFDKSSGFSISSTERKPFIGAYHSRTKNSRKINRGYANQDTSIIAFVEQIQKTGRIETNKEMSHI